MILSKLRMNLKSKHLQLLSIVLSLAPASRGAEPWDVPLAGDVHTMLQAAKGVSVPEDQSIVVLLEQHSYIIDENGRIASTMRKVYRIVKEDAVDDWSSVEQEYQPWHENKPEIRARVITEDGVVHWLDAKTMADSPSLEYDANIFSDRRVARAPLPAVAQGAVVEYQIILRETSPLLDAGETRRIPIFDGIPIQRFRISIEAPKDIPLKTSSKLISDSAIRNFTANGRTHFECDLGPLEPRKNQEGNLPADAPGYPYVAFSTGRSWTSSFPLAPPVPDSVILRVSTGDDGLPMVSEARPSSVSGSSVVLPSRMPSGETPTPQMWRAPSIRVLLTISFHWPLSRSAYRV